jgi:catechol 2,3-dioxygenase-like lactoylglutathione lyase family enzyme
MLFGKLFHTAIKTADLDATVRFSTDVLGMIVADRPPIGFLGAWLKPALHAAAEHEPRPVIAAQRRYSARERWFQPEPYRQFSAR